MFLDIRSLKYRAVQVYLNEHLEDAIKQSEANNGKSCTIDDNYVISQFKIIKSRFEANNNTIKLAKANPFVGEYVNLLNDLDRKYLKAGEPYIPSLLVIGLLDLYKQNGYKDFDDIDFVELLSYYEKIDKEDRKINRISLHLSLALKQKDSLDKFSVYKKLKKKRGAK